MPLADLNERRAYERQYHLARYHRLREERIALLGGKCSDCGSIDNLEFDHKDRTDKEFEVSENWGRADCEIELDKCQLLCYDCHKAKTVAESTKGHGTWGMYKRKCRCDICRAFVSAYMKKHGHPSRNKAVCIPNQSVL